MILTLVLGFWQGWMTGSLACQIALEQVLHHKEGWKKAGCSPHRGGKKRRRNTHPAFLPEKCSRCLLHFSGLIDLIFADFHEGDLGSFSIGFS